MGRIMPRSKLKHLCQTGWYKRFQTGGSGGAYAECGKWYMNPCLVNKYKKVTCGSCKNTKRYRAWEYKQKGKK